ncbi:hypothetical protein [Lacrimispora sp.]|uniref:hypothetical protein n=1 Tax=Lacrimispora sp. TaxID=2719234 RepID=UPI003991A3DB
MAAKKEPMKYKTESLLKSKGFVDYQQDFARVLLPDSEYTIDEAKKILNQFFNKKEGA